MEKARKQSGSGFSVDEVGIAVLKRNISFICFLALLGLFYIANSHYSEKKVRKIIALKKDLKELNWEYLTLKSDLLQNSLFSSLQPQLNEDGLELSGSKPTKIVTKEF